MTAFAASDLHRTSDAIGNLLNVAADRATKAGHPLRDEWPDPLDLVGHLIGHPIDDHV